MMVVERRGQVERHFLSSRGTAEPSEPAGELLLLREPGSSTRELQEQAMETWGLDRSTEIWGVPAG
ncbi:hypothetical protein GCM10010412_068590 [Nonomuraea recticatena]|uniref:Uncharacterized protein n=1 Tax=Nonomuraea recticatena TaxID=46178 RepID=A0ABN3SRJ9_9ACTN